MRKPLPDLQFETDIRLALAVPEVDPVFAGKLEKALEMQAIAQSQKGRHQARLRGRSYRWAWVTVVLMVALLLFVFRQPVMASIGRLFGYAYMPEVGFVAVNEVRALENAVQQTHEGRLVTVTQGLATNYLTSLWVTFSDEARPVDGAWLESPEGDRYGLDNWNYSPDEAGTTGVVAYFPPLPESVNNVTLILPEGWHLPLKWVPGSESSLTPANINVITPVGDDEAMPTEAVSGEPCAETHGITFCIKAVAREGEDLLVLIESTATGPYSAGDRNFSMFTVLGEVENLILSDNTGQRFGVAEEREFSQGDQTKMITTLTFPGAADLTGPLQLSLPAVLVSLPIQEELVVDLGEDPQNGQVIPLDRTLTIEGYSVHFNQATIEGDRDTTLMLSIESDPFDNTLPVRIFSLEPGRPEGVQDRYGGGVTGDSFSFRLQLYQYDAVMNGILQIPFLNATLKVRGPFVLTFEAPGETMEPTPAPEVVQDAPYSPIPTGEPLSMESYYYSGEALRSEDLLSIEVVGGDSWIFAASPDDDFIQRPIAILPGEVMAIHPHTDLLGMDYLTGIRDESGNNQYHQLYSVRFADNQPVLHIGELGQQAFGFDWSFDGRFLAYRTTQDAPGEPEQFTLQIVDLTCRTTADCEPVPAYSSGGLGVFVWSPVDYRLGIMAESAGFQDSDIGLLSLDPETFEVTVENLTQSPQIRDFGSMVWSLSGDRLFYPCEAGLTEINEYSLCGVELNAPGDQVIEELLPWNMHSIHMAAGRFIIDANAVMQEGLFRIRAYDLLTGECRTLLEWSAENKYLIETYTSTSGAWMAVTRGDSTGFQVVNFETQVQYWLESVQSSQTYFGGWVP
jgi:hypothetical protein